MGTRSTTKIYDNDHFLLAIYTQFDGYTDGWGKQLKEFILSRPFVNGIGDDNKVFNGAGCFALQLIAEFKTGAGGLYATTEGDSQSYNYEVRVSNSYEMDAVGPTFKVEVKCLEEPEYNETIIPLFLPKRS